MTPSPAAALEQPTWSERRRQLRAYVREHNGRFPPNRSDDPNVRDLGCWWVSQNIGLTRARLSEPKREALESIREFARQLRAAEDARRRAQNARQRAEVAREVSATAGRAAAKAAKTALKSPYLIPGDREVLQLRIDHPTLSLAGVAEAGGMATGKFAGKFYAALRRGPNSRSPFPKELPERLFAPHAAARMLGQRPVVLARWTDAGLVTAVRSRTGNVYRRYRGDELLRVQALIAGGLPAEFAEAAEGRGRGQLARSG